MRKLALGIASIAALAASAAHAEEIKIGVLFGFTGPIESLTPDMASGAELAIAEVNDSGMLLDGSSVEAVRGDSTCIDSAAAVAAAEQLVTADNVNAIVGADCSGVTASVLQNVARANGIVMISPSATSPALSTAEDDGLFFRTAPSDKRQGVVMSEIIMGRGYSEVAVTYTNNDYGKGLADSFESAFEAAGGTVTLNASHEDGKGDYSAEIGALDAAGGEVLVVAGYLDQGGLGIIQAALDSGAFDTFVLPDGMIGPSIVENVGPDLNGSFGQAPGTDSDGAAMMHAMAAEAGFEGASPFAPESYDAAALIMLAMQAAGSSSSSDIKDTVMDVANAPGEMILPGELAKGLQILSDGGEIDYVGASDVELIGPGEAAGNYAEYEVMDNEFKVVGYR